MIVTCEACATRFNLKDELVKPSGSKVRCSKCQNVFRVYLPIVEEPPLAIATETSDINLESSSAPPLFAFSQLDENEFQMNALSDLSSETPTFPKEYLDMTEYDFTEIDKLIQLDKSDKTEPDHIEKELSILPGELVSEPSFSDIALSEAKSPDEDPDKMMDIDIMEAQGLDEDLDKLMEIDFPEVQTPAEELDKLPQIDIPNARTSAEELYKLMEIDLPEVQKPDEDLDKLMEIDLSNLSLDQPEFSELPDDHGADLEMTGVSSGFEADTLHRADFPLDDSFEKGFIDISMDKSVESIDDQVESMNLSLDPQIGSSEPKPQEVSLDEFEKSLEMNFEDFSLVSTADEEKDSGHELGIAETETDLKRKEDLLSEEDIGGLNEIEDLDLSDLETLLEEQDAGEFKTSSLSDLTPPAAETEESLAMDDQSLTFEDLQLESESTQLPEAKESFVPDSGIREPSFTPSIHKESEIQKTEASDEEKPLTFDTVAAEEPEEDQPAPKKGINPLVIFVLILAVIAGLLYGGYVLLNTMGVPIPFVSKPAPSKIQDTGNVKMKPLDISSRFVDNTKLGKLFIVEGKVKNEYPAARGAIQVTGKLYTKDKAMAKAETVFCGNMLSDTDLANADQATIQERLQSKSGDNGANLKVAPGSAIPFMVVFSNLPENLEEFTLEVKASVPA